MSPTTKTSSSNTTTTITNSVTATSSNVTRCTSARSKYAVASTSNTTKPRKTAGASVVPVPPVSPEKHPPRKKAKILSTVIDEASGGTSSSSDSRIGESIEVDTQETVETTFDISETCRLMDYIVSDTYDLNMKIFAYVVKLKQTYNGMDFIRMERNTLHNRRIDLVETYANKFKSSRLVLLPGAESTLAVEEITNLGITLPSGEATYLVSFQNLENGKQFWVSERDMILHYSALLDEFKQSFDSAVQSPIIVISDEVKDAATSSNDTINLSSDITAPP